MFGIDMGTKYSKVAYIDTSGTPTAIPNLENELQTPSVVHFARTGGVLIGTAALEQGAVEPKRCVRNPKMMLGSTESLVLEGPAVTATDAVTEIIRYLKEIAEKHLGIAMTEVVATCPANFMDNSKAAYMETYERLGIKVLKLVPEPTAAGIAYACGKAKDGAKFGVYDWGGGTFDVSILQVDGSEIRVLSTEGVQKLGGNDIDECILRRVLAAFKNKFGKEPDLRDDAQLFLDLSQRVERAKISLNTRKEATVVLGYKGEQLVVKLDQAQFHADIEPLIRTSLEAWDRAVKAAGLTNSQIDRLLMVGGTSLIPHLQTAVANHTGLVPRMDIDPTKAVVYGGALACIAEMANNNQTPMLRDHAIPHPDIFVRDVTAHSVGCCVIDGNGAKKRLSQSVIIPKNTPIPSQKTDRFYLEHDDQTEAHIEILQGENAALRDDCLLIGELTLKNLPKENVRTARIHVQYTIDGNGMVTATATDKVGGQCETVSVDYKKGVKPRSKPAMI